MGHGLARRGADVDADGVLAGCELTLQIDPRLVEPRQRRDLLGVPALEEGSGVAARKDQRVSRRNRIGVAHDNGQGMPNNDPGCRQAPRGRSRFPGCMESAIKDFEAGQACGNGTCWKVMHLKTGHADRLRDRIAHGPTRQ